MMSKKHSIGWAIIAFFSGILFILLVWYVDFEIISPLILPEDHCYYHSHPTPYWVDFLYMSGGSNGHPDGSMIHFLLVAIIGATLGHLTIRTIRLNLGSEPNNEGVNKSEEVLDEGLK